MASASARRALGGTALALGALAAVAGRPAPDGARVDVPALAGEIARDADVVTAIELAGWIRDRRPGLRVLDVRPAADYETYHVPSAEHVPADSLAALRPGGGDETLVVYGGAPAGQAALRAAGFRRVYVLRGGLLDWTTEVMSPVLGSSPDAARVAALSRYFGGTPRAAGDATAPAPDGADAAVARLRRRGC